MEEKEESLRIGIFTDIIGNGGETEMNILGRDRAIDEFYHYRTEAGVQTLYEIINKFPQGTEIVFSNMNKVIRGIKQLVELVEYINYKKGMDVTFVEDNFSTLNPWNKDEMMMMRLMIIINNRLMRK
ncbi:MAG TPA: hypothetical protein DCP90_09565 [Clostridiales bacterium]|nr:MAG: hypothetical protein A2Y22_08380 [Clostridiales bacterium GWD2_32_59]HAN10836.1 hypothetical protein [Clostridiales bacterium]